MECSPARDLRFFGRPGGIKPNWSTGARAGTRPCAHARVEQLYDLPCGPLPAPLRKRMGPKRQKGGAGGTEKDRHPGALKPGTPASEILVTPVYEFYTSFPRSRTTVIHFADRAAGTLIEHADILILSA